MGETKSKAEERVDALQLISDQVAGAYSPQEIGVIQRQIAKDTTTIELAYFLNVCKTMNLNPFNKEVWCYKDNRGNLLIFAGRDGMLAKAQQSPFYAGLRSSEVCENDEFELDIANGKILHKHSGTGRGKIIGAYAIVFRTNGEPTIEWAAIEDYDRGFGAWKTHKAEMIKKCAEAHGLKKCFGISGIAVEYDYEKKGAHMVPLRASDKKDELTDEERYLKRVDAFLARKDLKINDINELEHSLPKDFYKNHPEYEDKINERIIQIQDLT